MPGAREPQRQRIRLILVVVDNQDPQSRHGARTACESTRSRTSQLRAGAQRRKPDLELCPGAESGARGSDFTAVQLHDAPDDSEPKTQPPARAVDRLTLLREQIEHMRQ